ncbi:MAG: TraX family protein [Alphaproteobacteria bacterium]
MPAAKKSFFRMPGPLPWENIPQLDGGALDLVKIAAAVFMVIDHGNEVVFDGAFPVSFMIGRGAFPLFSYALAIAVLKAGKDGERYAVRKYAPRIFVAALLSEPIYTFVMGGPPVSVLFTLALAAIWAGFSLRLNNLQFLALGALSIAGNFTHPLSDFGFCGVAIPAMMIGVMQGRRFALAMLLVALSTVNLQSYFNGEIEFPPGAEGYTITVLTALASIYMPLFVLNALKKMKKRKRILPKYALHFFYPGHLVLLWLIHFVWEMTSLGAWGQIGAQP